MQNACAKGRLSRTERCVPWLIIATTLLVLTGGAPKTLGQAAAGLKIVVIEGEGAVNIIQQKTAVAPVVEVRDRNDQPVAGAVVRFAIRNGRASFSGARTLTVTTNAAGRAAVTGLTPTGSGALQITASAAFQGQTAAAVTIAQTNVLTAAQAATTAGASGAGGGGSAAGAGAGAAGGGGGAAAAGAGAAVGAGAGAGAGLSFATIAIVGGAAAGGAVALKETGVLGGGGPKGVDYAGPFSGVYRSGPDSGRCFRDQQVNGQMHMSIVVSDTSAVTGVADIHGTIGSPTFTAGCSLADNSAQNFGCCSPDAQVTGTAASLGFSESQPGNVRVTVTHTFTGALTGTDIVGAYTFTLRQEPSAGFTEGDGGSQTFQVTLTKQ